MEGSKNQELAKGYDFLDLCNEIANSSDESKSIQKELTSLIVKTYKKNKEL